MESKHGFRFHPGLLLADRAFQLGPNPYESDKAIFYACISKLKSPSIAIAAANSALVLPPINDDEIMLAEDLGDGRHSLLIPTMVPSSIVHGSTSAYRLDPQTCFVACFWSCNNGGKYDCNAIP